MNRYFDFPDLRVTLCVGVKPGSAAGLACAADKITELNDFENSQCAKLLARIAELEAQLANARNELCLKCGRYHEAHKGACDGCRWKEKTKC